MKIKTSARRTFWQAAPAASADALTIKSVETFVVTGACFVKVTASNGATGWGEADADNAPLMAAFIHNGLKQRVIGQSVWDSERLWDAMFYKNHDQGPGGSLAQACSKPIKLHNTRPLFSTAAALHLLASISNTGPFVEYPDTDKFKDQLALMQTGVELKNGYLPVPQRPGLGVTVDEAAVQRAVVN